MAYKPKYAQTSRRPVRTEPAAQPPKQREKMGRGMLALFLVLGIIIVPLSTWLTANFLWEMAHTLGRPKESAKIQTADMTVMADVESFVAEKLSVARNALVSSEKPELPEVEVEPVRKIYWIEEEVLVAPEPNQELFGSTNDTAALEKLLTDARWILDGQQTYFQPNGQRYQDSTVHYYLDDSIFAVTWQEVHDGSVYTFSEVKLTHPSQFRRYLADGEYGSDKQYETTEMAATVNAVVASAGDFYRFRDFGAVVYQGEAKRVEGTYAETCYIDANGDLHFTYGGDVLTVEEVQQFVDEHEIRFSLAFGPILVENSELVEHTWYGVGEINEGYARSALCQMGPLHYIVVTANTTGPYQEIPTVKQFAKNVAATGCIHAYCLDGGQTATIVMNDQLMNRPVYGQQRKISDIIYFATAVPEGGSDNG
nr:phosphodiester glycosidase family protein [Oscillospiraceae bacterium]